MNHIRKQVFLHSFQPTHLFYVDFIDQFHKKIPWVEGLRYRQASLAIKDLLSLSG
jgi:hypothetical protein